MGTKRVAAAMVLGMLTVQSIAQAGPPVKIDLEKSSNIFNLGPPSSAENSPPVQAGPSPSSVAALESKLRMAAMTAQSAEYKAKLQEKTNDLSWRMLGHSDNDDFGYVAEAYAKAEMEGGAACNAWMTGRPAKVKAAAKVYCSIWKSTLEANAKASAQHEDFNSTPAGAQFIRAQAELEATADE